MQTLLFGDLNICYMSERNHPILRKIESLGFKQKVQNSTHDEGRQIDHVYFFPPSLETDKSIEVNQVGQYYTDHDLMLVDVSKL